MIRPVSLRSVLLFTTTPASRARTAAACEARVPPASRKRNIGRKLMPELESVRLLRRAAENDTRPPQLPQVSEARNETFGSAFLEIEL